MRGAFGVRGACSAPYTHLQSRRDCVLQPRVARNELPWEMVSKSDSTLKAEIFKREII